MKILAHPDGSGQAPETQLDSRGRHQVSPRSHETTAARRGGFQAICCLLAVVGLLSACSSGSQSAAHHRTEATSTTTESAPTTSEPETTAPSAPPSAKTSYHEDFAADDGTSESVEIEFWPVNPASEPPDWASTSWADTTACTSIDSDRDALVPFRINVTSTTNGDFTAPISIFLTQEDDWTADTSHYSLPDPTLPMFGVEHLTSGSTCIHDGNNLTEAGGSFINAGSTDMVSSGDELHMTGFIVLVGYYSPKAPAGDPSVLDHQLMIPSAQAQDGPQYRGLGLTTNGGKILYNNTITLSGLAPTGDSGSSEPDDAAADVNPAKALWDAAVKGDYRKAASYAECAPIDDPCDTAKMQKGIAAYFPDLFKYWGHCKFEGETGDPVKGYTNYIRCHQMRIVLWVATQDGKPRVVRFTPEPVDEP